MLFPRNRSNTPRGRHTGCCSGTGEMTCGARDKSIFSCVRLLIEIAIGSQKKAIIPIKSDKKLLRHLEQDQIIHLYHSKIHSHYL